MATIHLVDSEKGGAGKSLFARVLVEYCIDRQLDYHLVEADASNPDVGETFSKVISEAKSENGALSRRYDYTRIVFSEAERKADEADLLFDLALKQPVIVNLPAQVFTLVNEWIDRNNLLELEDQHQVRLCKWFVCTGGYDSVRLFLASIDHYGGKLPHILVRNWGLQDDWSHLEEHAVLQAALSKHKIPIVDLPKLSYRERDYFDEHRISFSQALAESRFGILGMQRVFKFLRSAHDSIDSSGMWNKQAAKPKPKSDVTGES
ncbi:mobilization protein [Microcoleus sp. FACHB-1515]|uniref:mobilization protein n=1 Tax=Cyanophyceae TaxID=3028117 RepID=UPI00168268BB|nr:mobilization protein [Microcoleus sp. FACHB-1515]MBD2093281.1 mobilization protein [Microcoleus sp. FACHB-1515]